MHRFHYIRQILPYLRGSERRLTSHFWEYLRINLLIVLLFYDFLEGKPQVVNSGFWKNPGPESLPIRAAGVAVSYTG